MTIAYTMKAGRDNSGRPIAAHVENYICVAKRVRGNDGTVFDFHAAIADPDNFDDKELRLVLQLQRLLGHRSGNEQSVARRVSLKKLGAALGCTDKTAKTRLEGLARRDIIRVRRVGRNDANTTHEVAWNLNFGDWKGIRWQGNDPYDEDA